MASVPVRHFCLQPLWRALLFALILLLASEVVAVRSVRVKDVQRAAQIVRQSVSIDASPQPEAVEGQPLRFIVRRSRASRERTGISYRLDNMPQFRRAMPSTVIEAGQTVGEILVPTVDDDLLNGDRNIVVTLIAASADASLGNAQATGIIRDNERPPVPTADIEAAPVPSVVEGGSLALTVRLRSAVTERTAIRYNIIDKSAATAAPPVSRLIIPAGSTDFPLRIQTRDDDVVNGERTIIVRLTAITGNGKIGVAQVQAVVLDNDREKVATPVIPRLSILSNGNAVEGEELTFTVFADSALRQARRINVVVSAPADSLIEPVSSSVLLRAGQTSALLTLLTADDAVTADARKVGVALVPGDGLAIDPAQSSAGALISDNDRPAPPVDNGPPDNSSSGGNANPPDKSTPKPELAPKPVSGFGATLMKGPVPAIALAVLLFVAGLAGGRRFILPRFYKVGWAMGVPHEIDASSNGAVSLLPPGGGVEIELGSGEALVIGPCPILSEEEHDDPDA